MEDFKKKIIKIILYLIILVVLFIYNKSLAMLVIALLIIYLVYKKRLDLFKFIGSIKYAKGKTKESLKWFEKAYNNGDTKDKTIILYAYMLLRTGNIDKAEEIFINLLEKDIDKDIEMLAKSNLALVIWKRGKLDEAISLLQKVHGDFKTTTIYGSLGYLLILKGDLEKALKFNKEAYEYNDSNNVILDNLGQTYYLLKDYDKALKVYEELMELNPKFPEAHYNYGLVLIKKDKIDEALNSMEKALEYEISFLNTVTKEDIQAKIKEVRN